MECPQRRQARVSEPIQRVGYLRQVNSSGSTSGFMAWLEVPHPPAGATTLIVSLGIITAPLHLAVLMAAVVALVLEGLIINGLAGIDDPVGAPNGTDD